MSWEQDFDMIIAPVNRIAGCEVRALEYLHWWSFLSFYQEIGDCCLLKWFVFGTKRHTGSLWTSRSGSLPKEQGIIDLKVTYTEAEKDVLAAWGISK